MTDAPSVTTPTHDTPPADPADSRRRLALAVLLPLFLTSGATSLVYETVWERELHLVAGTSQLAVITVLAAFMAGLAAGGFLSGRVADRVPGPCSSTASWRAPLGSTPCSTRCW
jgi:MFS family permease